MPHRHRLTNPSLSATKKRRDWLLRKQSLLRLTPFPLLAAGLHAQNSEGFERRSCHRRGSVVVISGSRLAEEVTPTTKFAILFSVFLLIRQHIVLLVFDGHSCKFNLQRCVIKYKTACKICRPYQQKKEQ